MRIAVIDDEKGILLSVSLFLESEGHIPLTFSSPLEALRSINGDNVDLIILDMRMPEMSGERVANLLKANPATRNIPLVLSSAHENLSEVAERVGAQGILEKPFGFDALNELIINLIQ